MTIERIKGHYSKYKRKNLNFQYANRFVTPQYRSWRSWWCQSINVHEVWGRNIQKRTLLTHWLILVVRFQCACHFHWSELLFAFSFHFDLTTLLQTWQWGFTKIFCALYLPHSTDQKYVEEKFLIPVNRVPSNKRRENIFVMYSLPCTFIIIQ